MKVEPRYDVLLQGRRFYFLTKQGDEVDQHSTRND
jgi:hypothetical protein